MKLLISIICFEVIVDSHEVERNNTEEFVVIFYPVSLSGYILQKLLFCVNTQYNDVDIVKIQKVSITMKMPLVALLHPPLLYALAFANLIIFITLSFQDCFINEIRQRGIFGSWLFSPSIILVRFIQVAAGIRI